MIPTVVPPVPERRWLHRALVAAVLAPLLALVPAVLAQAEDPPVDEFGRDGNSLSGTIEEVCGPGPNHDASASRTGRVALIEYLGESFPEVEGFAGFTCREIHNPRMSCAGRAAPGSSDCWSTHAAGRAIDVMVGGAGDQDGYPVGGEVGDRIVNHLLERVNGVDNYRARIMGVQQLLWNGTCWNSRSHAGDGITDVSQLDDDCVDLHDNHVHITLSDAGADGLTSFFTGEVLDPALLEAAVVEPELYRDQALVQYDATDGRVLVRGLDAEGAFTDVEATSDLGVDWTTIATPDVAGNGDHEVFAYRADTGAHELREIEHDGTLGSVVDAGEELATDYTIVATPDVDGDGDDELLLYRADDGAWVLHELSAGGELGPALQAVGATVDVFFSAAATPDLDGDGDDELVLYRRFDGHHVVMDFGAEGEDDEAEDEGAEDDGGEDESEDDGGEEVADEVEEDLDAADRARFDEDDDGEVDVEIELQVVEELDAPDGDDDESDAEEPDDDEGEDEGEDGEVDDDLPLGALGVSLSPGFTSIGSPDVDHDGIDELVFYREGDGCTAIRRVAGLDAVDVDDDEVAADEEAPDALPACLVAPDEDAEADPDEDEVDPEDLPPVRWMVESWDVDDAGWTAATAASIGDEKELERS